jgi:hypothetical protein
MPCASIDLAISLLAATSECRRIIQNGDCHIISTRKGAGSVYRTVGLYLRISSCTLATTASASSSGFLKVSWTCANRTRYSMIWTVQVYTVSSCYIRYCLLYEVCFRSCAQPKHCGEVDSLHEMISFKRSTPKCQLQLAMATETSLI